MSSSSKVNRTWVLASRPKGEVTKEQFKLVEGTIPEIKDDEILLKTLYLSVDPYLRGRMNEGRSSYVAPFEIDSPIAAGGVAEVIESKNSSFKVGSFFSGLLPFSEYNAHSGKGLTPLDTSIPLNYYLGALGMPGFTAYFGIREILQPKAGETFVVSGAAGAVGSVVGQLLRAQGVRVVGSAGTDEKVKYLKEVLGFDEAFNYKTANVEEAIKAATPKGIDGYFENTGGEVTDAVYKNLNNFARIAVCGVISSYNATSTPTGPRIEHIILTKRVRMQGFIVSDYYSKAGEALKELIGLYKDGKLKIEDTITEGFESVPEAFLGLFTGKNTGKMVVRVASPSKL